MSFKASSPVTRCFVLEWFLRYIIIFFCISCLSCFADKVASPVILSKKQQKFFTIRPKNVIPRICRLDFRRLPGPVFDPHFPEQRLVIEPIVYVSNEFFIGQNNRIENTSQPYTLNVNENKWCDEIRRGRCYKLNFIKRLGRQKSLKPLKLTNGNSERERDGNSKLNAALSFPSGE